MTSLWVAACVAVAAPAAGCDRGTDSPVEPASSADLHAERSELRQRVDSSIARTEAAIERLQAQAVPHLHDRLLR
jgi:hypothetical protein